MRRPARRGPGNGGSPSAGFLLVEALAAMAISAVILLGLASTLALMTRAGERAGRMAEEIEAASRAVEAIARDLRGAERIRWSGSEAGFVFSGDPDRLVLARGFSAAGPVSVVVLSAGEPPGARVLRSQAVLPADAGGLGDLSWPAPGEIYGGAGRIRFAYFAALPDGREALLDSWSAPGEMPRAVRVAFLDPDTGRIRSSVRVPLPIDAEPGCAAPSTALCSFVENGEADAVGADDQPRELVDPNDPAGWMRYAR